MHQNQEISTAENVQLTPEFTQTSSSDIRGTKDSCVTRSAKSYDADVDNDVFLDNELLLSSSSSRRDFVGGAGVTATSEACFLRFTASPDNSWPPDTMSLTTPTQSYVQCIQYSRLHKQGLRCHWQTHMTQRLSTCYIFHITAYGYQTISFTQPSCWIQISMVGVINRSCLTTIRRLWHSPEN